MYSCLADKVAMWSCGGAGVFLLLLFSTRALHWRLSLKPPFTQLGSEWVIFCVKIWEHQGNVLQGNENISSYENSALDTVQPLFRVQIKV